MSRGPHPLRFRLRGGRNTHAVRFASSGEAALTACGQMVVDGDERLHDGTQVTCSSCTRELGKAA